MLRNFGPQCRTVVEGWWAAAWSSASCSGGLLGALVVLVAVMDGGCIVSAGGCQMQYQVVDRGLEIPSSVWALVCWCLLLLPSPPAIARTATDTLQTGEVVTDKACHQSVLALGHWIVAVVSAVANG
jgi:hypothetical protein